VKEWFRRTMAPERPPPHEAAQERYKVDWAKGSQGPSAESGNVGRHLTRH